MKTFKVELVYTNRKNGKNENLFQAYAYFNNVRVRMEMCYKKVMLLTTAEVYSKIKELRSVDSEMIFQGITRKF